MIVLFIIRKSYASPRQNCFGVFPSPCEDLQAAHGDPDTCGCSVHRSRQHTVYVEDASAFPIAPVSTKHIQTQALIQIGVCNNLDLQQQQQQQQQETPLGH